METGCKKIGKRDAHSTLNQLRSVDGHFVDLGRVEL